MSDPVWLPDVLRAAGLEVVEYPAWRDRGHGDFGEIWGVIMHHTGSNPPGNCPQCIAEHPDLGLASQLHLSRDGVFTVLGAGIAWHAGAGSYPGLPTNNANQVTIGIEAENNGTEGWSDKQYVAYITGVAAILKHLGQPYTHAIGHKEWAGSAQGKWDPGGMDMNLARQHINAHMTGMDGSIGGFEPVSSSVWDEQFENFKKQRVSFRTAVRFDDQFINEIHDQVAKGWAQLGHTDPTPEHPEGVPLTLVDAVANLGAAVEQLQTDMSEVLTMLQELLDKK